MEQHGSITGQLINLLGELRLPRVDAQACAIIADSLLAAGLRSTPTITPGMRRDTVLELTLLDDRSPALDRAGDTGDDHPGVGLLRRSATSDPRLQRLFQHEMFGVVPEGCLDAFRKLDTVVAPEALIGALRVRHGVLTEGGFLMITTSWLRYVKHGVFFTALASDDLWPLDGSLDLTAEVGSFPVFRTPDGGQFQIYPAIPLVSRKQANAFLGLYRLAALAFLEDPDEDVVTQQQPPQPGPLGIAGELRELADLRDSGALSDSEFEAAKARLLGG